MKNKRSIKKVIALKFFSKKNPKKLKKYAKLIMKGLIRSLKLDVNPDLCKVSEKKLKGKKK